MQSQFETGMTLGTWHGILLNTKMAPWTPLIRLDNAGFSM
jgi:hypothetical protein